MKTAWLAALALGCGGDHRAPVAPSNRNEAPPADAAVETPDAPASSRDEVIALSRYGFFTIAATARTRIFVDGHLIGETPMTRLPLAPGPHVVKLEGPGGVTKELPIVVVGGQDLDQGTIRW